MGRWGFLMFQGDDDIEAVLRLQDKIGVKLRPDQAKVISINLATKIGRNGLQHRLICRYPQYAMGNLSFNNLAAVKTLLNSGIADQIMNDAEPGHEALVFGAIMMMSGATISAEHRQLLKTHMATIPKQSGVIQPLLEQGGMRKIQASQYTAALNSYVDGQPHDFFASCCWTCGKFEGKLMKCTRCVKNLEPEISWRVGHYCNKDCQKANWYEHKGLCFAGHGGLNV